MDYKTELAKWDYNKGNSIDVEILVDEILPSLFSQQERMYSENEVFELLQNFNQNAMEHIKQDERNIMTSVTLRKWFEQFKKK